MYFFLSCCGILLFPVSFDQLFGTDPDLASQLPSYAVLLSASSSVLRMINKYSETKKKTLEDIASAFGDQVVFSNTYELSIQGTTKQDKDKAKHVEMY